MKNGISLIGLVLTAIGSFLLWKFGISPSIDREGRQAIHLFGNNDLERKKAGIFDRLAKSGFALIFFGTVLQAISIYLPNSHK